MTDFCIISVDTLVVGSGAAGFNAACRIRQLSEKTVAIVTEEVLFGTSRNTGSDKQTYYKLGHKFFYKTENFRQQKNIEETSRTVQNYIAKTL